MAKEIRFYRRDRAEFPFLSNFFPAEVKGDGILWPTSEHYYQACKIPEWYAHPENIKALERIRASDKPLDAKRAGKTVKLRRDWEAKKQFYMTKVLRAKFGQHKDLAEALLDTKTATLIEDSPHDHYWGIGSDGSGKNRLGKLLMELRDDLNSRGHQQGYGTIRCLLCNDIIQSMHVHDFRFCFCGAVAVDGGRNYLKVSGDQEDFEILIVGHR